jgi:phage-related protein
VKEFFETLSEKDAAAVAVAMEEIQMEGLKAARHLRGKIYEVRTDGTRVIYRILFAPQGGRSQILLTLASFEKKTQKTPPQMIRLAHRRLRDWEQRGIERRKA